MDKQTLAMNVVNLTRSESKSGGKTFHAMLAEIKHAKDQTVQLGYIDLNGVRFSRDEFNTMIYQPLTAILQEHAI